ncbi:MAG: acetyl-CoA C-acyltransferase [Francisellaceae bacterium]|jgi:acetyl-CoA C-acetyltransferase|nr:acetyl-CoA C-acyltransferase [Francisellaceae bacterium]MBT6538782.1 acetyl-CoA C-acyltransferase [Francisellaceae bacterium]
MNNTDDPIVIVSYARTPIGAFQGVYSNTSATELGSIVIKAALERANLQAEQVEQAIVGCVLSAGLKQAPARQAALGAGLLNTTGCTTVNKMCGSGMQATMMAHDSLVANSASVMVAAGIENMTQTPYILPKARSGMRMGHGQVLDHMFVDGLEDAYEPGKLMGAYADDTATKYNFSRESQDEFALESLQRARAATEKGLFKNEITAVDIKIKRENVTVLEDETPKVARPDKIPHLKPAFKKNGTVTAANSSSISDGAAALIMMRESQAKSLSLTPVAKIVAHATNAHEPAWFTTAPIGAISKVLNKANWSINDVDLFEINEAFAVVTMAAMHDLKLDHAKVNIHGGACALGHPVGATGTRILCTLISALQKNDLSKGVASLCIGGGEATAIAIERI